MQPSPSLTQQCPAAERMIARAALSSTADAWRPLTRTFVVLLLSAPVAIEGFSEVPLSLASIAAVLGLGFFLLERKSREKQLLIVAIALACVSLFAVNTLESTGNVKRPFVSAVYFFHCYLIFFAGRSLVSTERELADVLGKLALFQSLTAIAIALSVIGKPLIDESYDGLVFTGNLLGLPLFGALGYNALIVYFTTAFAIVLMKVLTLQRHGWLFVVYLLGLISLAYLITFSLSRQAMLGLLLFLGLAGIARFRVLFLAVAAAGCLWFAAGSLFDAWFEVWEFKLGWTADALDARDLDEISSQRLGIYAMQLEDLARHPLLGSGFHGFQLYGKSRGIYNDVAGLSPHCQYLGAVWKMGLAAAFFYFAFLYRAFFGVRKLARATRADLHQSLWALCLVYLWIFCVTQDALLFPLTGGLMMFLCGAASHVGDRRTAHP